MSDEELQGDDPTLIAIIASAHGYYVDDFNDAPLDPEPHVTVRFRASGLIRIAPTWLLPTPDKTMRWHSIVYVVHRAA